MAEVTQTILFDPDLNRQGIIGNCLQAAVASVLDLPLDAVPHFSSFVWWHGAMELWAGGRGLTVRRTYCDDESGVPLFRCIVGGKSPRGVSHVVVYNEGSMVWDPHPSRAGLVSVDEVMWFEDRVLGGPCWVCGSTQGGEDR